MNSNIKIAAFLMVSVGIAGCTPDPKQYETTPVHLKTAKGNVVCQLYTKETVLWDRAIDWPRSMNYQEADAACIAEGKRLAGQS